MAFWQRVEVQSPTESRSSTGAVILTYAALAGLDDVEARVLPLAVDEQRQQWATPEEDAYEVQVRGAQPTIRPLMRVVVDDAAYDIRRIVQPPPFGDPMTVLQCVRVTP